MNCDHVQELLPLYVGRDLEEKRAKLVTAHVQSCGECAGMAADYRDTKQLLHLFEPPRVSDAVYAGIRRRVLREIERESKPYGFSQLVASIFVPRVNYTVATMLLLAVFGLAFYFIANRKSNSNNAGQHVAGERSTVDPTNRHNEQTPPRPESAVSPSSSPKRTDRQYLGSTGHKNLTIAVALDRTHQYRKKNLRIDGRQSVAAGTHEPRSMTAEASPEANRLAEPDTVRALDPITSEKPLRVEMQTRDRNIRIIWFSHPPAKQGSPNKSFKGIPEVRSDV